MTNDDINWKRMVFKKNKVWLATDKDQKPITKNGKVLIRYQLDQDYEYWVLSKNIKPIDSLKIEGKIEKVKKSAGKSSKQTTTKKPPETDFAAEKIRDDAVYVYTDGASAGNPGPSGIGVVLRFGKHEKEISRYIGDTTNNVAELEAIRSGLMAVKNTNIPVRVFTDSRYAYGVLTQGWKAKKNQNIIESIKKILSKFNDLKFIKVRGHVGIEGNERADFLATSAIKNAKTK
jgi:ribonuclease HI